jgi:acetyl esterase
MYRRKEAEMEDSYWIQNQPTRRRFLRGIGLAAGALTLAPAIAACRGSSNSSSGAGNAAGRASTARSSSAALHLADQPVAFHANDVDYLQEDGTTYQATIYQPEGLGPFPAILEVHGGVWVGPAGRDADALVDKALAAMGIVVAAIDFRQDPQHHYPDSVTDVNFAMRWLRANASKFNASPQSVGAFGASSGGYLVLLNGMRPFDSRYAALPLPGASPDGARPDYIIAGWPVPDPIARLAYVQQIGNDGAVVATKPPMSIAQATDVYFSTAGSIDDGNPQLILDRHEPVKLPPVLLLQGSADANGVMNDKLVSPAIQQRFAASYQAAGGQIQLELFPGAPHGFADSPGADADRAFALMKTFIGEQLAKR